MKKQLAIAAISILIFVLIPNSTSAALLRLTPPTGHFTVGDEFDVQILADTQGQAVNTAETNITYSTNTLELVNVTQGSTFLFPTPASPNRGSGSAYIGGGLPTPGFNGSNGLVGVLRFKAKAAGNANVNISRGRMLLNDGFGSEAVLAIANAKFVIEAVPVNKVIVSSPTHPMEEEWSKHNDLTLNWVLPKDASEASFDLDQNPNTTPDDIADATDITAKSYPKLKDGVWYFHIKAKGKSAFDPWGSVTHYRIQIDTVAPLPFEISLVAENELENVSTTPTIKFSAQDVTSGPWRYDVYIDNKLTKEIANVPFSFSKQELGDHIIKVIAYDRAGNGTEAKLPVKITVPGKPLTIDYFKKYVAIPLYGLLALNLLVFVIIGIMFQRQKKQVRVATVQTQAIQHIQSDVSRSMKFELQLTDLKKQIDTRFDVAAREQTVALDTLRMDVSRKIEVEIETNVNKLREEIETRISQITRDPVKAWQIKQKVSKNIVNEMQGMKDPQEFEVLRRLYKEFMHNEV